MHQKLKKLFLSVILIESFLFYSPAFAQTAQTLPVYNPGVDTQIQEYLCTDKVNLFDCINKVYKFSIVVAAVMGVFFIVIAGYLYMSSGGSDESVKSAKEMLTSTIASLVILMAGYVLLRAINPDLIQFHTISPPGVTLPADAGLVSGGAGGQISGTGPACYVISGFNIAPYATAPTHEALVQQIYNALTSKDFSSAASINQYLKSTVPSTPLTGDMVLNSAQKYSIDAKLLVALMQTDSSLGTLGRGAGTFNPGNVGNDDAGNIKNYGNWQSGVDAVANWLSGHRLQGC